MKALEKDRTRRYDTANGLARDVDHYLKDEPVEACPPSTGYRLRKLARKNKKLLATAAAIALLLFLGVMGSAWQAVRATQAEGVAQENERQANEQRDDAKRQHDEVKALGDKLETILYAAHINLAQHAWETGRIFRVKDLLDKHRPKQGESDLRGFEWQYLDRLCHPDVLTLKLPSW
jgi:hypothetical protein